MKRKDLFGLGIMLASVGSSIFAACMYSYCSTTLQHLTLIISSLFLAMGGYVMLFAVFDR